MGRGITKRLLGDLKDTAAGLPDKRLIKTYKERYSVLKLIILGDEYRRVYASFGRKDDFFWALRYETARYFHKNWHDLFLMVSGIASDG